MKKHLLLDCDATLDTIYYADRDENVSLMKKLQIKFHLLFCPSCGAARNKLQNVEAIMMDDFFPPSSQFEDSFMEYLYNETETEEETYAQAGFSFRSWVIIGVFVLFSLSTAFFGMNFIQISSSEGLSFLLPVGLTIGLVVTCYGALFIGSHLKELSTRFRL